MGRSARRWVTLCTLIGIALISPSPASFSPVAGSLSSRPRTHVQGDRHRLSKDIEALRAVPAPGVREVRCIMQIIQEFDQREKKHHQNGDPDFLADALDCAVCVLDKISVQAVRRKRESRAQTCLEDYLSLLHVLPEVEHATDLVLGHACYTHGETIAASALAYFTCGTYRKKLAAAAQAQAGSAICVAIQQAEADVAKAKSDLDCAQNLKEAVARCCCVLRGLV